MYLIVFLLTNSENILFSFNIWRNQFHDVYDSNLLSSQKGPDHLGPTTTCCGINKESKQVFLQAVELSIFYVTLVSM